MTMAKGAPGKCLVIQEARFGDLIQSKPLLDHLSRNGECRRVLLVRPGAEEAARSLSLAEEVRVWPSFGDPEKDLSLVSRIGEGRDFVTGLRQEGFDRVVVMNHHGTGIALARLLGIPLSGFDRVFDRKNKEGEPDHLSGWPGYLVASSRGIRAINRIHLSDMWLGFGKTEKEEGIACSEAVFTPEKKNPHGPVVVVLGGRSPYRRWDREPLSQLIRSLRRVDGGPVVLTGGPEDAALGESLARECGEGVENMAGRTGISDLSGLVSSAGAVVSPDTASLHLASALGVPTVGLFFASALPFETGAYRQGALSIVTSMDCYPCAGEGSSCAHRSCRSHPEPVVLAEIVSAVKRGMNGQDLVGNMWGKMTGVELWQAQWTSSGLVQRVLTPRLLTRERVLARLLRRFVWRYLNGVTLFPDIETELSWEGTGIADDREALNGAFRPQADWSLWFMRLERGVGLYSRLRERDLQGFERKKLVDRLASEFPMIWPVLHHLEWVEGGAGPQDRLTLAAGSLAREAVQVSGLMEKRRGVASLEKGRVHVAV